MSDNREGATLRDAAEARLRANPVETPAGATDNDLRRLVHELQVHQIEMELQNETLRQAQIALEDSRDRYADLYEFAPVGYLTLSAEGRIVEINLFGTVMLGMERGKLLQRSFEQSIIVGDTAGWRRHLASVLQQDAKLERELVLLRGDGSRLDVRVTCQRVIREGQGATVHVVVADISRLKNAEQELHQAQRIARMGNWYWDAGTDAMSASDELCRIFGRAALPPLAEQRGTLYSEDAWRELDQAMRAATRSGTGFDLELPALRADGDPFWVHIRSDTVCDAAGKVVGLRGSLQDITVRRLAEDRNQFHSHLLNAVGQAVIATDAAGSIQFMNLAAEALYGWPFAEARGRNIIDVTVPAISMAEAEGIMAELRQGRPWSGDFMATRRDRTVFPVQVYDTPLVDDKGRLTGIIGVSSDISERKKVELDLRRSRQLLDLTMQLSNTGGWELDLVDHASHRTRGHDRIFGYEEPLPTWTYETFLEHVLAEDKVEVDALFRQALAEQADWNFECRIRRHDGEVRWILAAGGHQRDDKGQARSISGIVRDITDVKRFEQAMQEKNQELERARAAAEKANRAKTEFLSSMSHELRTPLNSILGFAQLMETGNPPPTATQQRDLERILKAGWYLLELINEILDLSMIESGKAMLTHEPVPMADVFLECRAMVEPQAAQRGIALSFPQFGTNFCVNADRIRVKQVLINLMSNAVKYNRHGGTVDVECRPAEPEAIRIGVRDTGDGLAPEQLEQLFQPFNRLGKEAGTEEGTGIGLVVCKRLIELMGGRIGVESKVGVGSEFWIELPRANAPPSAQATIARTPPEPAPEPPQLGHGMALRTVLCVEDNAANLELVEQLVARRADLRLLTADDGKLGIEFARTYQPRVILMDVNLPDMSGSAAMKILRADPATADIPIIALSANAMPGDIASGLADGFCSYLTKPIRIDEFMAALDAALKAAARGPRR